VKKRAALVAAGIAVLFGVTGCSKYTEPWNDAKIEKKYDDPAEVYSMPDGFSNVATKCDVHGNRIYVVYHGDNAYGSVDVVANDPSCAKR
jgi:hypothetical protein